MNKSRIGTLCGMTLACGLAFASATLAHDAAAEFQSMDTNGDGKISADEHAAGAKKMFDAMDADHDGKVTAAEMDAAHAKRMGMKSSHSEMSSADKIKVIDTDGDGVLTAAEHAAGARSMFDAMDTDKDGSLSKAELEAGHAKLMHKPSA
ncbi:MAG: EF-hand domain-containing protein [Acidobacteriota bacterium]